MNALPMRHQLTALGTAKAMEYMTDIRNNTYDQNSINSPLQ